jgi:hypothetical protein
LLLNQINMVSDGLSNLKLQLLPELAKFAPRVSNLELSSNRNLKAQDVPISIHDPFRAGDFSIDSHNMPRRFSGSDGRLKIPVPITVWHVFLRSLFGSVVFRIQNDTRPTSYAVSSVQHYRTTSLILHPGSWLLLWGLACGIQLSFLSNYAGWKYVLSQIRSVPDNSLIFRLCEDGNISATRELLLRGDASVWDTDSSGRQPLYVSISYFFLV